MGLRVAQDEAQLKPGAPFSRPRTFKKEGQKTNPKKDAKNDDEGAKMGPEMGPKNRNKRGSKTDPNIISLIFGSLRLSRVGTWPCQAKMQAKS